MLKDATLDLGLGPHIRSLLRSLPLGRLIPVQCHLQWQGLSRSKRSETAAGHGLEGLSVWVLEFQVVVASGLGSELSHRGKILTANRSDLCLNIP